MSAEGGGARRLPVFSDDAELVVDCAHLADRLGLDVGPALVREPLEQALTAIDEGPVGVVLARAPEPSELALVSRRAAASGHVLVLGLALDEDDARGSLDLAGDLGIVAVRELRPTLAALALVRAGARAPFAPSLRALSNSDRARLGARPSGSPSAGKLTREDEGRLAWGPPARAPRALIGEPTDNGAALRALEAAALAPAGRAVIDGVDERAVADVLFGPPRALSDPASKAALAPYGLPTPIEELCTSPSRAAGEAARMGFPVRIALASPDLRIWDHPDLAVDGIDNASRVRDVFRQVMSLATERSPTARLLGVTVTATTPAIARLSVVARPLSLARAREPGETLVVAEIGFADPHGSAASDRTTTVLPLSSARLEQVLGRLAGAPLLRSGSSAGRRALVEELADTLLRVAAFVDRHAEDLVSVELRPLAVLLGGGVEVREACVTVGDRFLRTLEPAAARP